MKKLFISLCTEHEAGCGQRPDGAIVAETEKVITAEIKKVDLDAIGGIFWRYTEPFEVFCEEKTYKKIKRLMGKNLFINFGESFLNQLDLYINTKDIKSNE